MSESSEIPLESESLSLMSLVWVVESSSSLLESDSDEESSDDTSLSSSLLEVAFLLLQKFMNIHLQLSCIMYLK